MNQNKREPNIGALWSKTKGDLGEEFFIGIITIEGKDHKIKVEINHYKRKDNHPDYQIFFNTYVPGNKKKTDKEPKPPLSGKEHPF